jgi:hypothetical protein
LVLFLTQVVRYQCEVRGGICDARVRVSLRVALDHMEGQDQQPVLRYHLIYVVFDHRRSNGRSHDYGLHPVAQVVRAVDEQVRLCDSVAKGPCKYVIALILYVAYYGRAVCPIRIRQELGSCIRKS